MARSNTTLARWRGQWALLSGASAGIGAAMAHALAGAGAKRVLSARRQQRLNAFAAQLRAAHGATVEVCPIDLGQDCGPQDLFAFTEAKNIPVALLANNAGFGSYGEFRRTPLERLAQMVQVNVSAVVKLTWLYLPQMVERGGGDILVVASTAAFQAFPYMSTYAATKSFDLLFAEGLAREVWNYGVRVCALCPATTQTEFAQVAGREVGRRSGQSADQLARVGLKGLASGKSMVICGLGNRLAVISQRLAYSTE